MVMPTSPPSTSMRWPPSSDSSSSSSVRLYPLSLARAPSAPAWIPLAGAPLPKVSVPQLSPRLQQPACGALSHHLSPSPPPSPSPWWPLPPCSSSASLLDGPWGTLRLREPYPCSQIRGSAGATSASWASSPWTWSWWCSYRFHFSVFFRCRGVTVLRRAVAFNRKYSGWRVLGMYGLAGGSR
jgi:hypothetical protein